MSMCPEAAGLYHWWFVLAGVGAALAYGLSTHFKQLSTADVPTAHRLHPRAIGRLVRASIVHRLWLAGVVADVVGLGLQILALHLGPLSAVQPLLVLGLLVALLLQQRYGGRLLPAEIAWALLVTAALAGVIVLAGTSGDRSAEADPGAALAIAGVSLVLAGCCLVLARSRSGGRRAAALLGVVVGGVDAATAALVKVVTDIAVRDPVSVLWHWQFYVLLVAGSIGLVLNQIAFRAGPLTASLPAMSTVNPLLSIVIGIWVFDEQIRGGLEAGIALVCALLALILGVIKLVRISPPLGS